MRVEPVTYRRIRAAIVAALDSGAITVLGATTELAIPGAAAYARDYMLLERHRGVRITPQSGRIEIGPERRALGERRSGSDRRLEDHSAELWAERRAGTDRRSGVDRRSAASRVAA